MLSSSIARAGCVLSACAVLLAAQNVGTAPLSPIEVTDIFQAFQVPVLTVNRDTPAAAALAGTAVGKRAAQLGLSASSALEGWTAAAKLLDLNLPQPSSTATPVAFSGASASELNRLLAGGAQAVTVVSSAIRVDEPIRIARPLALDLGRATLTAAMFSPYMLRIDRTSNVSIRGGVFASGTAGILVNASQDIRVEGVEFRQLRASAVIVTGSQRVLLSGNRVHDVSSAGIVIHRDTSSSAVLYNQITSLNDASNVSAAIAISDREVDLTLNPRGLYEPDGFGVLRQDLSIRLHPPHDNLIAFNNLARNLSSGIYVDGAVRNLIAFNTIEANAKEGLCLDNGATANAIVSNTISRNGKRWGQTDQVLSLDHIAYAGRLSDGSAAAKVPGVSIDNAAFNIVFANSISRNFGGGIKMVRTGYANYLGLNTLFSNNEGASASFHFFGIELGNAPGGLESPELDFTGSRGNIIFSNSIRGNHYSGIYVAGGSDGNEFLDNTILDATDWAIEAVAKMENRSRNNLTNLPSRNIGSGIDPELLKSGEPVYDPETP